MVTPNPEFMCCPTIDCTGCSKLKGRLILQMYISLHNSWPRSLLLTALLMLKEWAEHRASILRGISNMIDNLDAYVTECTPLSPLSAEPLAQLLCRGSCNVWVDTNSLHFWLECIYIRYSVSLVCIVNDRQKHPGLLICLVQLKVLLNAMVAVKCCRMN